MSVQNVGATASPLLPGTQSTAKNSGSDLTINDFFKLISAQLQNQSMYDTADNTEFMTQMVQFTTLSQMNELTAAFQSSYAVGLIGKKVNVITTNQQGQQVAVSGEVEQVSFSEGIPYVYVNGGYYQLSEVLDVEGRTSSLTAQTAGGGTDIGVGKLDAVRMEKGGA